MGQEKKYDVGIMGLWSGCNYGSIMTYYALNRVVDSMGKSILMIDKPILSERDVEREETHSRRFGKEHYDISKQYRPNEMHELNDICDTFLIGSDQVWNYGISKNFGKLFYFDFVDEQNKKLAYAVSFGHGTDFAPPEERKVISGYMARMDGIAVREADGVRLCREQYGIKALQVLDPVFLADPKIYTPIIKKSAHKEEEPFMVTYILDPTPEKCEAARHIAEKLGGIKIISLLDGLPWKFKENKEKTTLPNCIENLQVEDWLYYLSNAKFILTDSCHGASFALIFKKNFIAMTNRHRGVSRFKSLSELFKFEDRLVEDPRRILTDEHLLEPLDYVMIDSIMKKERTRCREWLKDKLDEPKRPASELKNTNIVQKQARSAEKGSVNLSNTVMQVAEAGNCTGCSACASVCPKNAITIRENQNGFLQPEIDEEKCVNCGICLTKCISEHPVYKNSPRPACFAMMANDETRKISSSGGMFSVAAEYVLEKGGYVCGAAYRDDFTVEHILISDKAELSRLRGSKYMQSHMGHIYEDIKALLEEGKMVLFTGMPCQTAGLYASLGKDYENLYTIDLFCHGITSSKVFQKYHHDVLGGNPLARLEFKEKAPWGWHAGVNAYFKDGSKYSVPLERDPYFIAYLKSLAKNTSCATCTSNRLPRQGDMTIGDFWGIARNDPEMHDGKGTSAVLVNNEKGTRFFEALKDRMKSWKEESLDVAIRGNRIIQAPYRLHRNRNEFFKNFSSTDFTSLTMGCFNNRIYEMQKKELLKIMPESDIELYYLAKAAVENSGGRKIIAWMKSPRFEEILRKYFDREVYFSIVRNPAGVDNKTQFPLSAVRGKAADYYVVGINPGPDMCRDIEAFGYREIKDYIFRMPRPVVLDNFDCGKGRYEDAYGNTIEGVSGIIGRIVFRGGNNHIVLGERIRHMENLSFDLVANSYIEIGAECAFNAPSRFIVIGRNGNSEIKIREKCRFTDVLTRVYNSEYTSSILINDSCSFESHLELHANSGKKIIVGRDCMFSHNIDLWAGDGHTVFDVVTGKNTNSDWENLPPGKNALVIGNHVWIGKGAFIMHGTNIGDGSIVGAMSMVKGTYPNNCTVFGNPARVAKRNVAWSRDMVAENISQCGREEYAVKTSHAKAPVSGRKVLVIGGTRFMGVHLVRELIALGNDVTIATRGRKPDDFGIDVKRLTLDVSSKESCQRALKGKSFDVVFDNLAYCSEYADNVLENVQCKRYVQLSSVEAYKNLHIDMKEAHFDPYKIQMKLCAPSVGYVEGKRQAEAVIYQKYKNISAVTVRIPYVAPTERLYYYCKNMIDGTPMRIKDVSHAFTFIRAQEVGKFLPWIAAQDFNGPVNLASSGFVSIQQILDYIAEKTHKTPVVSQNEELPQGPFTVYNENRYSLNLDKAVSLGWKSSNLYDWFWDLMDRYIAKAFRK
ncbi:MAG: Coenzyme F420 hydrogenase/dehydrogenase, beta subunit C-terminal domain [Selenomonas sp.]|nr:Coenzyme F420 hydrogenase/dehydrogenase, beta subunit C-terminal domain [Selenomonas sp.]